jgi:hypothetical protein
MTLKTLENGVGAEKNVARRRGVLAITAPIGMILVKIDRIIERRDGEGIDHERGANILDWLIDCYLVKNSYLTT